MGFHAAERNPPILVAAAVIENLREWWGKRAIAIEPSVTSSDVAVNYFIHAA